MNTNFVTEKQASEKLCHARIITDHHQKCSASKCMAWRWVSDQRPGLWPCRLADAKYESAMVEPPRPSWLPEDARFCPAEDDEAYWVESDQSYAARCLGYCGLVETR